jgi:hypothetical protein
MSKKKTKHKAASSEGRLIREFRRMTRGEYAGRLRIIIDWTLSEWEEHAASHALLLKPLVPPPTDIGEVAEPLYNEMITAAAEVLRDGGAYMALGKKPKRKRGSRR